MWETTCGVGTPDLNPPLPLPSTLFVPPSPPDPPPTIQLPFRPPPPPPPIFCSLTHKAASPAIGCIDDDESRRSGFEEAPDSSTNARMWIGGTACRWGVQAVRGSRRKMEHLDPGCDPFFSHFHTLYSTPAVAYRLHLAQVCTRGTSWPRWTWGRSPHPPPHGGHHSSLPRLPGRRYPCHGAESRRNVDTGRWGGGGGD